MQNIELYELHKSSDIITDIKIARLRWAGHVQRMKNDEIVKRIMEGKPEGRRGVGRPCSKSRDTVQEDVMKLKIQNWWTVARSQCAVGNSNLSGLWFFITCTTIIIPNICFAPAMAGRLDILISRLPITGQLIFHLYRQDELRPAAN